MRLNDSDYCDHEVTWCALGKPVTTTIVVLLLITTLTRKVLRPHASCLMSGRVRTTMEGRLAVNMSIFTEANSPMLTELRYSIVPAHTFVSWVEELAIGRPAGELSRILQHGEKISRRKMYHRLHRTFYFLFSLFEHGSSEDIGVLFIVFPITIGLIFPGSSLGMGTARKIQC